jgi:hypothetical protein
MDTSMNIHGTQSITYQRVQFETFWTHRFTVVTGDGSRHEFDAFSYVPDGLQLTILPDDMASSMKRPPVEPSEVATA